VSKPTHLWEQDDAVIRRVDTPQDAAEKVEHGNLGATGQPVTVPKPNAEKKRPKP
jgi:hypothetical protein